ncbi:MAG: ABC transporter substrate-binding protein [Deltaproteobacteria bacterium]|nr:MAG: ABC transporter substrate-binding protein [Deltaproteobacteria bacterium]
MRALVAALLLVGCSLGAPPPDPGPRIASLSPALTETLGALDALDTLIARSEFCVEPPEARALPTVGSSLTPDLERLARLRPRAILVDDSAGTQTEQLERIAPTERLPWLTVDQVGASIRRLGELSDRAESADRLADRLSEVLGTSPPPDAPEVLAVLGSSDLQREIWFVRRDSLHGAMMQAAGARNAIDRDIGGAPTLSLEALIKLDPQAVVILHASDDPASAEPLLKAWRRLKPLRAVQQDRVKVVADPKIYSTGPQILDTVERVREVVQTLPRSEPR